MKDFEYYIKDGKVKKQSADIELAKSLRNNLVERARKVMMLDLHDYPLIIFENLYDAFREICDAILALDGYKSYSHEASITYLKKYGIEESVLIQLDNFRFKRNASKYYGKTLYVEDAEEIKSFYKEYFGKLLEIFDERLKEFKNE